MSEPRYPVDTQVTLLEAGWESVPMIVVACWPDPFSGWAYQLVAADERAAGSDATMKYAPEDMIRPALPVFPRVPNVVKLQRQFCRVCQRSVVPVVTVEVGDGKRFHFCGDHQDVAQQYVDGYDGTPAVPSTPPLA